jgi:hypothetical protein
MEKHLGSNHPDTLELANKLVVVYWSQGRSDEAEALENRTPEKHFGSDRMNTLSLMDDSAAHCYSFRVRD